MELFSPEELRSWVRTALQEDLATGDATTEAVVPQDLQAQAVMVAREPLVVAGLALAETCFRELSPQITLRRATRDGEQLDAGRPLLHLAGPARAILSAERSALNYIQRLSGIATLTAQFVRAVAGTKAQILDTRKTTPGWRRLEKYAVVCGGGKNHRFGLFDQILIKDNHLVALDPSVPDPIGQAVQNCRRAFPNLRVEVEADRLEQVEQAVNAGADAILLDNMPPDRLRAAVSLVAGRAQTEASGGITLAVIRAVAETGVDFISVGALTHSARAVDIALDFKPGQKKA